MISEDDSDEDYSTVFNKKSKKEYQNGGNFKGKKSKAVEDILADSIDGSLEGIDATSISSRGEIRRSTRKRTPVIRDEFSLNESFVDEVLYYFPTSPTKYLNSSIVKRMRPTRTKVATTYNMDMVDEDDKEQKKKGPNNKTKKKKDKTSKDIEDIFQDLIDGSLEIIRDDFSLNESLITEVRNNNYEVNSSEKLSNDIIPDIAFNGTPEICESAQESQDNAHSEDEIEIVGVKIKKKFTPKRVFNYIPPKQYEYNTYKS
ncbi:unnamed protein product [Lepeophtheirus salmonis]|uniref:(salmon louse) hypothetical protein n=1 Tax=Lepeophtheirus salmonis TaxID=72036 RepID=A0A7R8CL66_LEPSM|nr:unnamed protein product [Lepeophtheirus salmonis]CAF2852749.1 unnamed protein product [Lepeophtheirus salmonis]